MGQQLKIHLKLNLNVMERWHYQLLGNCQLFSAGGQSFSSIFANGPPVKLVSVTRRKHRAGSWYFSQKFVTVQGGYGVVFAVMVQILLRAGAIAVQV